MAKKKLLTLAKELEFTTEQEYFEYLIDSYINGCFSQCKNLFNEMSKAIVESNIDNREKDVKHILEKRKFRIQLGIICFGIIAFIALLVGIMPD